MRYGKKRLVFLLICILSVTLLDAQEVKRHSISADVGAMGLVGFSNTYRWYSGVDLKGNMHVDNTDVALNFEALTANVYSIGMTVRPNFEVCENGIVFAEGTLHSRFFGIYKTYEFVYAGSVGYRMRHFEVQLGLFSRTIDAFGRNWHSVENYVTEPFNLLYRAKVSVMGFDNPWDVYFIGGNFNDYEYERMWEPIFSVGGRWDFRDRWSAVAEWTLEPAGMFHGTVKFYDAIFRIGVTYKL
jgi:hypothetical protein